ncbi:UbiA-like polyprenyltransferase [Salinispira pacifica]
MVFDRIRAYGEMVMFSHSLFSLPFALMGLLLASGGRPSLWTTVWVVIGFTGGRNCANALNRIVDRSIDGRNPRTAERHLPAGRVSVKEAWAVTLFFFGLLVLSAAMLNAACVCLLPVGVLLIGVYSFTKRVSALSHLVLGAACAAAPIGGWVAVTGRLSWDALLLGAANALWVAGFDVIYATQDVDFDRREGLHSVPALFGVTGGLRVARLMHLAVPGLLVLLGVGLESGALFYAGVAAVAALLLFQHAAVRGEKMERVPFASYSVNQVLSIVFFVFVVSDLYLRIRI